MSSGAGVGLDPEALAAAFPFHFAFDADLRLVQVGEALGRLCPAAAPGTTLAGILTIDRPEVALRFTDIRDASDRLFILRFRSPELVLRGQFIEAARGTLLFLGSPWLTSTDEMERHGLSLRDFALHDPVVDMLQLLQAQKTAIADQKRLAGRLEEQRTALREAHAALEQRYVDLERLRELALDASRAKTNFLANMSHEIRTPLHAVIGSSELLLERPLGSTERQLVETIQASGVALMGIVSDILDLTKIESGQIELELVPFAPAACCQEALAVVALAAREKGLHLTLNVDDGVPPIATCDAGRVRQVLFNLLANAVKFTTAGGVELRLRAEGIGDAARLVFSVIDTGIGIGDDQLARLFEPFRQGDASTARRYGGTGLGLSISSRLATALGGSLTVSSIKGEGSVFTFEIPLVVPGATPVADTTPACIAEAGSHELAGIDVLVVEDNEVNRSLAELMLARLGCTVTTVASGFAALSAVAGKRFDVILMDVQMPELDGVEATRQIRSRQGDMPGPWIIALTANALERDRETCLEAGMNGYVTKPFRSADLLGAIGEGLAAAAAGRHT